MANDPIALHDAGYISDPFRSPLAEFPSTVTPKFWTSSLVLLAVSLTAATGLLGVFSVATAYAYASREVSLAVVLITVAAALCGGYTGVTFLERQLRVRRAQIEELLGLEQLDPTWEQTPDLDWLRGPFLLTATMVSLIFVLARLVSGGA